MALVVLLRGVNVGGHRTFRPSVLVSKLKKFDVVNIGAAGTFVARAKVSRAALDAAFAKQLPFETEIMICDGAEVTRLVADDPFGGDAARKDMMCFVSLLKRKAAPLRLPLQLPPTGRWLVRVVEQRGRFVLGQYRRDMKTVGYLGQLDKLFGGTATTRNWNTMQTIARIVAQ